DPSPVAAGDAGAEADGPGPTPRAADAVEYVSVTDPADLPVVAAAVAGSSLVGLDLETTGLDPRAGRVRLVSLATDSGAGTCTYLVDADAVDPAQLFGALDGARLVGHNLAF